MAPESKTLEKLPHYTLFVDHAIGFPDVERLLDVNAVSLPTFITTMRKIGANTIRYAQTKEDRLRAENFIEGFDELMAQQNLPSFRPLISLSPKYKECLKAVDQWKEEVTNAMGATVRNLCWQRIETLFNPISEFDDYCSKIEDPFDFGKAISELLEIGCSAVDFLGYLDLTLQNMRHFWGSLGGDWAAQYLKQSEDLYVFLAKAAKENLPEEWAEIESMKWSKRSSNAPSGDEDRVSRFKFTWVLKLLNKDSISNK